MVTVSLVVAYDGSPFSGFARQPAQLTVQGELEKALRTVFHEEILTTCAGRTDAGVHAKGQVVSFDLETPTGVLDNLARFKRSLNALTHDLITIRDVCIMEEGFSARFDAISREYRYYLAVDEVPSLFLKDFSWHVGALDLEAMRKAAIPLIGEHDFKSFCKAISAVGKPTSRNVISISIDEKIILSEKYVIVTIIGSSFLHSMVRNIVGTLVEVGKGKRAVASVAETLAACDRKTAGECAPAHGLVFWKVNYDKKRAEETH